MNEGKWSASRLSHFIRGGKVRYQFNRRICVHQSRHGDTVRIGTSRGLEWISNEMRTDFGRSLGKTTVRALERIWRIM